MVRRLRPSARPWTTRRAGSDADVDRINDIANGLVVASLAFDMNDEEMARRAVEETRRQASQLLADAVLEHDARERRRYVGLWASGAATTAAMAVAAALVLIPPTSGPTPVTADQVAHAPAAPAAAQAARAERLAERTAEPQTGVTTVSADHLRLREAAPPQQAAEPVETQIGATSAAAADPGSAASTSTATTATTSTSTPSASTASSAASVADEPEPPHQGTIASGGKAQPPSHAEPGSNRGKGRGNT